VINRLSRAPSNGDAEVPSAGGGPLGVLPEFRSDPLALLRRAVGIGDIVLLPMGSPRFFIRTYMVSSPRGIEHVLAKGRVYRKSFTNLPARSIFGLGLLTSDGPSWVEQRRILRPVFQRDRIDRLDSAVTTTCDELINRWRAAARAEKVVDLGAEMASLSLQILLRSTFGHELSIAAMNEIAAVFRASHQGYRPLLTLPSSALGDGSMRLFATCRQLAHPVMTPVCYPSSRQLRTMTGRFLMSSSATRSLHS
jgi:cytochrome P450